MPGSIRVHRERQAPGHQREVRILWRRDDPADPVQKRAGEMLPEVKRINPEQKFSLVRTTQFRYNNIVIFSVMCYCEKKHSRRAAEGPAETTRRTFREAGK